MWLCLVVVGSVGGGVIGTTPAWVLMSSGIDMVKTLKPKTCLVLLPRCHGRCARCHAPGCWF